ncbi:cold-shock protein [Gordonia sp. 'Campus']|uniref:cold-shock protein n=1 Tax=Gordonia sp. 'Campus' TaxID=2915824 RepID=UPI001EE42673|nr:cold shock domain-containing protein [Gordonia sp. 'Campus']
MTDTGTIREWHHDAGWGVIESSTLSGTVYVESSVVRLRAVVDLDGMFRPGLRPGTAVEFDHAIASPREKGCRYVALAVWPSQSSAPAMPRGAYRGALWHSVGSPGPDGLTTIEETIVDDADVTPPETSLRPNTSGTVRFWRDEEGWGVLDSEATPGGAWAHFSAIVGAGYRTLAHGQPVEFQYEAPGQDGYPFRANNIRAR